LKRRPQTVSTSSGGDSSSPNFTQTRIQKDIELTMKKRLADEIKRREELQKELSLQVRS